MLVNLGGEVAKIKVSQAELDSALYKRAVGYETDEVVMEYVCDESGDFKLSKKKITKKFVSPDLQCAKMLLDKLKENSSPKFRELSDEELFKEKQKTLEELEKLKKV